MVTNHFTLWRYVFGQIFKTILAMIVISFMLLLLISIIESLQHTGNQAKLNTGLKLLMALYKAPSMVEQMLPFSALVGGMGAFLNLSRRQELVVARSIGYSIWQLLVPALLATLLIGTISVTLFNPFAAYLMEQRDKLDIEYRGGRDTLLASTNSGLWLRQDGVDGQSVLRAGNARAQGQLLENVTFFLYRDKTAFSERIEAATAKLGNGSWTLTDAWVVSPNAQPQFYKTYLVSTYLTVEQVQQSFGNPNLVSFWALPAFIETAQKAGVSAISFQLRYQNLLSLPALLCAMVLIAATVSLKVFRFGRIGLMIILGMAAGLCLFLSNELMRDIGTAGLLSPTIAVWLPVLVTSLATATILLYQEDG